MLRLRTRRRSPRATTIGWDPDAGRIDAPALEGLDAVVHLAGEGIGEKQWTDEQKRRIRDSRVRGTAVLAAAIASRERKPRVLVSGSAIGYYGNRGDEVLTEESAPGSDFLAGVAEAWEAETRARDRSRGAHGAHRVPASCSPRTAARCSRCCCRSSSGIGGRQGSGKQWMSWIALADEVGAIRFAIENETLRGPVNLVAPNPVTNAEFAATLGQRAAPADVLADADAPVEAALRRRARRDVAAGEPAGRAGAAPSRRLPVCLRITRRRFARGDPHVEGD